MDKMFLDLILFSSQVLNHLSEGNEITQKVFKILMKFQANVDNGPSKSQLQLVMFHTPEKL